MKRLDSNPKLDGYRMPGEFERHKGTYMIWPERPDNWRLGAKPAQKVFAQVANTIAKYEPITMVVSNAQFANARNMLDSKVRVVEMSNDDSWMRDCGASFLINDKGGLRAVDWAFNAWGGLVDGLYFPWDKDDAVAQKMCELENADRYRLDDFILEGGSIHVDGEGTVMTCAETLL
jgi:agmatine deiminase